MLTISLEKMKFHAPAGLYPEERALGNDLLVDVHIHMQENENGISRLDETIDYTKVYSLISEQMKIEYQLLETLAQESIKQIHQTFSTVSCITMDIRKLHPPLPGEVGCSKVSLSKNF